MYRNGTAVARKERTPLTVKWSQNYKYHWSKQACEIVHKVLIACNFYGDFILYGIAAVQMRGNDKIRLKQGESNGVHLIIRPAGNDSAVHVRLVAPTGLNPVEVFNRLNIFLTHRDSIREDIVEEAKSRVDSALGHENKRLNPLEVQPRFNLSAAVVAAEGHRLKGLTRDPEMVDGLLHVLAQHANSYWKISRATAMDCLGQDLQTDGRATHHFLRYLTTSSLLRQDGDIYELTAEAITRIRARYPEFQEPGGLRPLPAEVKEPEPLKESEPMVAAATISSVSSTPATPVPHSGLLQELAGLISLKQRVTEWREIREMYAQLEAEREPKLKRLLELDTEAATLKKELERIQQDQQSLAMPDESEFLKAEQEWKAAEPLLQMLQKISN